MAKQLLKFFFTRKDKKTEWNPVERESMQKYINSLPDGEYHITIHKKSRHRSDLQMGYLWGCVYTYIAEEIGYTVDEIHEMMKDKFLKMHEKVINKKGDIEEITLVRSLSKAATADRNGVSTVLMTEYIENIRRWAASFLYLNIPDPERWGV